MKYEELLDEAYKNIPELKITSERFEIPKAQSIIQGNKTIITNFLKIAQTFRRDPDHFQKYLLRELATPGNIDGPRLIINRKISSSLINQKIEQYAKDFVICKECGKPDTTLNKEDRFTYVRCQACGARHYINSKI